MITEKFQYCPHCGKQTVLPVSPIICTACGLVLYLNPAPSAVAILCTGNNEILLIERKNEPRKGKLALPGGFIDFGETAEEAVRREVNEELNLELGSISYVGSFLNEYTFHGVSYRVLDFAFAAPLPDPDDIRIQESEIAGYKICVPTPQVFENLAFISNASAIKAFFAA